MLAPTILILLFYINSVVSPSSPWRANSLDCVYMGNLQQSYAGYPVLNGKI